MASAVESTSYTAISKTINLKSMLAEIRNNQFSGHYENGSNFEQYFRKIIPEFDGDFDELKESFDISHLHCDVNFKIPEEEQIAEEQIAEEESLETLNISHPGGSSSRKSAKTKTFHIPQGNALETLKYQKIDVDKRYANEKYAAIVENDMQTSIYPYTERVVKDKEKKIPNAITLPELLLTVKIYNPTNKLKVNPLTKDKESSTTKGKKSSTTKNKKSSTTKDKRSHMKEPVKLTPSQEFLVIGHQDLTDLRKQIVCSSDNFAPGEFSENPDAPCAVTLKDLCPSGFFYINGTFYNDMEHPNSTDISKVIREWAETEDGDMGPYTAQSMKGVQFIDLTIELGHPYVFCHLGNCEHLFIFSEVRAMDEDDCLDRTAYPKINKHFPKNRALCMVCQLYTAIWSVTADMLPISPHLLCDDCLKSFFYTEDGKKNSEFELKKVLC